MLRIITIDDEPLVLENLKYVISQLEQVELAGAFTDPRQALQDYLGLQPDAVLVDINMPLMNGMDFAEQLRELDVNAQIIFLTAYDTYALDAFQVSALDYLMKPVTVAKLRKALLRVRPNQGSTQEANYSLVKIPGIRNNRIHLIDPAQAAYITVQQRDVVCVTASGHFLLKQTIGHWEELLRHHGWFRCHRCFLINMDQVSEVSLMFNNTYDVHMKDIPDIITVSRTYAKAFKEYLHL